MSVATKSDNVSEVGVRMLLPQSYQNFQAKGMLSLHWWQRGRNKCVSF